MNDMHEALGGPGYGAYADDARLEAQRTIGDGPDVGVRSGSTVSRDSHLPKAPGPTPLEFVGARGRVGDAILLICGWLVSAFLLGAALGMFMRSFA